MASNLPTPLRFDILNPGIGSNVPPGTLPRGMTASNHVNLEDLGFRYSSIMFLWEEPEAI